jgi:hypothetical protein
MRCMIASIARSSPGANAIFTVMPTRRGLSLKPAAIAAKTVIGPWNRNIRIYEHDVLSVGNASSDLLRLFPSILEVHDSVGVSFSDFACPVGAAIVRDDEFVVEI